MKALSFGGHRWNKTIAQREAGYEAECGAPEARARRDFGVPVLGEGIPIACIQEVEGTLSRKNRSRDGPRLNLSGGWGRGVPGPALRRANRFTVDRGKPDCGGLKVGGELGLVHDLRDRAADPNGPSAKGETARRGLARTDFSPDKKLAVPESGVKFQDVEREGAHVCRQGH